MLLIIYFNILILVCQGNVFDDHDLLGISIFKNCHTILGNLIINGLREEDDISDLNSIHQIKGYLMIINVSKKVLQFPNLQLIQGVTTYNGYSLIVENNSKIQIVDGSEFILGLEFLELPSLVEILKGNVIFQNNPRFCYNIDSQILWNDLWGEPANQHVNAIYDHKCYNEAITCPSECSNGLAKYKYSMHFNSPSYCWSHTVCQTLTRTYCHSLCHAKSRCIGPEKRHCCNPECMGLCSTDSPSNCTLGCKHFTDLSDKSHNSMFLSSSLSHYNGYIGGKCVMDCNINSGYDLALKYIQDGINTPKKTPNLQQHRTLIYKDFCLLNNCPHNTYSLNYLCLDQCPIQRGFTESGNTCLPCRKKSFKDGSSEFGMINTIDHLPDVEKYWCPNYCSAGGSYMKFADVGTYKNCEIVLGDINIVKESFENASYLNGRGGLDLLEQNLGSVRIIMGYLKIQYLPSALKSLEFFKNLKEIRGLSLPTHDIVSISNTNIEYLGLKSLTKLGGLGNIKIANNSNLCYTWTINWNGLRVKPHNFDRIFGLTSIAYETSVLQDKCGECHSECVDGCWGPGDSMCVSCLHYKINTSLGFNCVPSCPPRTFTKLEDSKADKGQCIPCHPECSDESCFGPGPTNCTNCKNVRYKNECFAVCPQDSYPLNSSMCTNCSAACYLGCSGPSSIVGSGGCNYCKNGALVLHPNITHCLPMNITHCPTGFYMNRTIGKLAFNQSTFVLLNYTCLRCHPNCLSCKDASKLCHTCKMVRVLPFSRQTDMIDSSNSSSWTSDALIKYQCEEKCPSSHYQVLLNVIKPSHLDLHDRSRNLEKLCFKCFNQCASCDGPGPFDCHTCIAYKLLHDYTSANLSLSSRINHYTQKNFSCLISCPADVPYVSQINGERICSTIFNSQTHSSFPLSRSSYLAITTSLIIIAVFLIFLAYYICHRRLDHKRHLPTSAHMSNQCYSSFSPDLVSQQNSENQNGEVTRLVNVFKRDAIQLGRLLGSGAFGTVHKGLCTFPDGQIIPVAIKSIMGDNIHKKSEEILQEINLLINVKHECLINVLGICMNPEIMIVTELVELGSMLDFLRDNDQSILIQDMILWATQIAKGMAYLEKHSIIHRDLAARNILVRSLDQVLISDFGSARLMKEYDNMYASKGGKMPYKWLAIETLKTLVFTHKSDVWAYGVTIWEMFTYGKHPYENIKHKALCNLLQNGYRLPKPNIASARIYQIMLECWTNSPSLRPTFIELIDRFSQLKTIFTKQHSRSFAEFQTPYQNIYDDILNASIDNNNNLRYYHNVIGKYDKPNAVSNVNYHELNAISYENTYFKP
ncbi:unnamed protein product [Gordionus sp. m RMFG-2023]